MLDGARITYVSEVPAGSTWPTPTVYCWTSLIKGLLGTGSLLRRQSARYASRGHEFQSQNPHVKSQVWWHMPAIPLLKRQSRVDHWSLLDSQPSLTGKRPCFRKQDEKGQLSLCSGSAYTCVHVHMVTHKGASTDCERAWGYQKIQ